jgi:hypothetical protein
MTTLITNQETTTYNGREYKSITVLVENQETTVTTGMVNGINVIVKNASHKVWRGCGKDFTTFEQAIENYKSGKVKAAILTAKEYLN